MEERNLFTEKSPLSAYFTLALPVVISSMITIVYNVADTYFIAMTGNTALVAGVSLCAPVFTVLMAFGNIFGQGGSSLIARLFGGNQIDGTRSVSSFCFYASLVTGAVIGAVMLLFASPLLTALGADTETIGYARPYFLTMAVGAPFVVLNFIHMNLLRSEGLSTASMIGTISGLAVNVVLDPILILACGLGSFGAALATVIGYVVSDLWLLCVVLKKSRILSVSPRVVRIPGEQLRQILGVGISAAVTNWMSSICLIITNRFLLPFGSDRIAAMGIAQKLMMIVTMIAVGLVFGSAPLVGYYYGAGRNRELKRILLMILGIVEGVTIVLSLLLILLAGPAVRLFLQDAELVSAGALMLRLQVVTMCFAALTMLVTVCFQAAGLAAEALAASVLRQGVVFLPVIFLASRMAGYFGVLSAQAVTDVISAAICGILLYIRFLKRL